MPVSGNIKMQGGFLDSFPTKTEAEEGIASYPSDPLELTMDEEDLCRIIDDYSENYYTFYKTKYNLFERRKANEIYLFGRQIQTLEEHRMLKDWESKFHDNVLYEIEGTIKPLAMSRIPDFMVTPGNDNDESVLLAQELGKVIDTQIKEYDNRFCLGLASKHFPCYFISCIKVRWNPEIDDYVFEVVHPDLIEVDYTAQTKDVDKMKYFAQIIPLTIQDIIFRFPQSREKFLQRLKDDGLIAGDDPSWALLATTIKIREVWFTEYKRHEDNRVERIDGVCWKYKDVILHKMKNPNFDYEGREQYFAYDNGDENTKRQLNEMELSQMVLTGDMPQNVKKEQIYYNYFKFPRKPFYLMGYDQWGKQPMDETSRIEQNVQNQKSLDRRGKQIEETLDSRGHHVLSKQAVTPSELEEIDFDEPNVDLSVEGNPNEVYDYIPPERPTPEEFKEIDNIRTRMYAVAHSQAVRGEIIANTPATNNQIAREGDFTAADDLVEDTINQAANWMAEWAMQFIKLRYTKDHFKYMLGIAGEAVWMKINRNMIQDGMLIKIKASGTDKMRAQNNAIEMAKMQMTDPYSFFVDMGLSDPEGRTERLILAKTDPTSYLQKVVKGLNTSEAMAQALIAQQFPSPQAVQPQQPLPQSPAMAAGAPPPAPVPGQQPQQPSVQQTGNPAVQPPAGAPSASPRIL